jgi:hypothetical protein
MISLYTPNATRLNQVVNKLLHQTNSQNECRMAAILLYHISPKQNKKKSTFSDVCYEMSFQDKIVTALFTTS